MTTITTTAAATQAHVTVATIRTWCRVGAVAAVKQAGRWVIDTASLTARIAIGAMRSRKAKTTEFAPLCRADYVAEAARIGAHAAKDVRCFGEYRAYKATGAPYFDDATNWLMIRRGATLAAEGYTPPARRVLPYTCDTCGLDSRTCDCY